MAIEGYDTREQPVPGSQLPHLGQQVPMAQVHAIEDADGEAGISVKGYPGQFFNRTHKQAR